MHFPRRWHSPRLSVQRRWQSTNITIPPPRSPAKPTPRTRSTRKKYAQPPSLLDGIDIPLNLPISPLLNEANTTARARNREHKPAPTPTPFLTPFQRALHSSPHAHALASPLRTCSITETLLPRHFLQGFSTIIRSTASKPNAETSPRKIPFLVPARPTHHGPKSYVLLSAALIGSLAKQNRKSAKASRLVDMNLLERLGVGRKEVWRFEDGMVERVAMDIRIGVLGALGRVVKTGMVVGDGTEDGFAAVLDFAPRKVVSEEWAELEREVFDPVPETPDMEGGRPVYAVAELFTEEQVMGLKVLLARHGITDAVRVGVMPPGPEDKMARGLLLGLHRLEMFLRSRPEERGRTETDDPEDAEGDDE